MTEENSMTFRVSLFFIFIVLLGCKNNDLQVDQDLDTSIHSILEKSKNKKLEYSERIKLLDSALYKVKEHDLDSLELSIISLKSDINYNYKHKDSSLFYDRLLLKKARSLKSDFYQGKANMNLALHFYKLQITDSAFYRYSLSKYHFLRMNDSSQAGRKLMSMGLIQQNQSDYFGSKETLTEALQFLNTQKDSKYVSSCYSALATNHRKLLNFKDALKYYTKAISSTNSENDKLIYQNNLAATYIDAKNYSIAISLLGGLSQDSLLRLNKKEHARVLDNLAYAQWLSGIEQNPSSFLKPLHLRKQNQDKRGQIASYTHLGEFYTKTKPRKAIAYFDSVIQLSKQLKIPRAEKDALRFLMKLKPKDVTLRDRYVFLQDSLYAQELKVKTQFAKYKYDDKVKQEENLQLAKENVETALQLEKERNQKLWSYAIGGLVFLVSSFGIFFLEQRTKRLRKEKERAALEATYQTEGELSRRLHDDQGAKLNHTILLVQNDANKSAILDNLEVLYDQSRDFSREINEVATGPDYKDELLVMLGARKTAAVKLFTYGLHQQDWSTIPALTKTTIFKVLQELMINMGKHSKANTVAITFKKNSKFLKINYEDDGIGASKKALQIKNGLRNTEKRITAIGGTITFDTEIGKGFRAEIHLPQ